VVVTSTIAWLFALTRVTAGPFPVTTARFVKLVDPLRAEKTTATDLRDSGTGSLASTRSKRDTAKAAEATCGGQSLPHAAQEITLRV
jgi:hypothetical protein